MQTNNRFFDDIAKMANGAMSAAAGVREEMEQLIRQQFEQGALRAGSACGTCCNA